MEIATSQLQRIWRLALIGAATAFAWILLTLLVGLGSGHAQAAEGSDEGLLGALTSVVDSTSSTATKTVSTVTDAVADVAETVVATTPAPVQRPVQQAVSTVGSTVAAVAKPVAETASSGVVSAVTEPIVETVSNVPVVGRVVTAVGLDDAVNDLGKTVDDTLKDVGGSVVDDSVELVEPPVIELPELPVLPSVPALSDPGSALASVSDAVISAEQRGAASEFSAFLATGVFDVATSPAPSGVSSGGASDQGAPLPPAGGLLCPPSASSSGPGGAGSGAWALVALGPLAALRAWGRRTGPEDDRVPAAPPGSTDVSPD